MSITLFNDSWSFCEFDPDTAFADMNNSDRLYPVDVPHDWMIHHTNDLYRNSIGFYKKTFNISVTPGHKFFLAFDGVYMDSKVYINEREAFEWKYGYSSFEVDITPFINDGANTVCVSCNYASPNSRWYSGAGIYRNVYLIEKDCAYLPSGGIYFSSEPSEKGFRVKIDTEIISSKEVAASIKHTIRDADGWPVYEGGTNITLLEGESLDKQSFEVCCPKRWDIDNPYLYRIKTQLYVGDKVIDEYEQNMGFRTIRFDCNEGFFLNERRVEINGACEHHDLGALGSAMNKVALRRQFEKLMAMGVNSIRTSHNMPAREVMELADEMGILIYTESFDMWELPKTEHDYGNYFPDWWQKDVTSWVRRDRNHPSLIIWGIGNEIYDTHAGNGLKWTRLLRDEVRKLDYFHNGYIGIASNYIEWENAQKCSDELELSGYNYGERLYDAHHEKYPNWCIFGSETSSTVQSRGIYHFPLETSLLTCDDAQCSCLGNCTTNWGAPNTDYVIHMHRDRKYAFGQYIWTGWDYIGEPTPYFSKNSFFGQIDTAGFEKDTFYHYQAEWTDYHTNPFVHLLPYWDFNEGQIIDVCAYSNAPFVELFFNGQSQGKQFIDHEHGKKLEGHWKLPYKKGVIRVLAYNENGEEIASDTQKSFDDPVRIVLKAEKDSIIANGEDLTFISISSEDSQGTFVANAKNRVEVSVTGPGRLVGLDNGDSTDYDEYKGTSRRLFSGRLLAIIASTGETGPIKVEVTSDGLESASLMLESVASNSEYVAPCTFRNKKSSENHEIPIRKIELINSGSNQLNKDFSETDVNFEIYPKNATYNNVTFKALTKDAVDANFVKIDVSGKTAHLTALGDGDFRLTAFAGNDKDHAEVISELEFSITGLGQATHDPYNLVPGCLYSSSHSEDCKLSFQGGVFLPKPVDGVAFVTYDNVDFGDFGSDEVTLPIFSFHDDLDLEVWEGGYKTGECLVHGHYHAKTWYNHYQENVFKLSRRIKGTTSVTFAFITEDRISFEGFTFTKPKKAYSEVYATENARITGDSFTVTADAITSIGNNVSIEFENMNFDEGISSITVCGRSHKKITSIHILFTEGSTSSRQMIEIPYSEEYKEFSLPLETVSCNGKISFVFLPGSDFDLKSFKFNPTQISI